MRSTSDIPEKQKDPKSESLFNKVFGGEFLTDPRMRPWYLYFVILMLLVGIAILSEQRIVQKQKKIKKLEQEYKTEISKLKANNQFIPYEQNKALIETLKGRGYVFDESSDYTVTITTPKKEKFLWLKNIFRKDKEKDKKKDAEEKSK
ncbi:MAG: hypothetical protein K6A41_01250 [Bacteroidales bacterium]|nr:hypothetical protein [Bacteroidales bacterium]